MPGEVERPPGPVKSALKRTKSTKKKRLAAAAAAVHPDRISPLKRQLEETRTWTKDEMGPFLALKTAKERVKLVYSLLPFDATGLDRLWPIQIVQKDSRIRRKLCERGKELFMDGEWEQALHHYNEACLFSSEKGAYNGNDVMGLILFGRAGGTGEGGVNAFHIRSSWVQTRRPDLDCLPYLTSICPRHAAE